MRYYKLAFCLLFSPVICAANNLYAGISAGHDSTDFFKRLTIVQNDDGTVYDKKDHQSGTGIFGDAFIGYQLQHQKFFLGTELDGSFSTLKYRGYYTDSNNNESSWANYTIDKSYGISLLPGYFITDNVGLYARLGYIEGNFKYSEYKNNSTTSGDSGLTERKWLPGIKYGVGTILPLQQNLHFRLEYDHIQYQTFVNTTFPLEPGQLRTIKIAPNSDQFSLGLVYAFA